MKNWLQKYWKHCIFVGIIFIVSYLVISTNDSEFQNCVCNENNKYTNQQPKERASLFFFEISSKGGCIWHWLHRNSDPIIAGATLIIAFFTISIFLNESANRKRELRAYLGIVHGRVEPSEIAIDPPGTLIAWIDIHNKGQTPAYHVRASIAAAILGNDPAESEFKRESDEGKEWAMVPDAKWARHRSLGVCDLSEVEKGNQRIWVWGHIQYVTVFNERHLVEFRYYCGRERPVDRKTGRKWWPLIPDEKGYSADYGE